jgi:hypothetical protein
MRKPTPSKEGRLYRQLVNPERDVLTGEGPVVRRRGEGRVDPEHALLVEGVAGGDGADTYGLADGEGYDRRAVGIHGAAGGGGEGAVQGSGQCQ